MVAASRELSAVPEHRHRPAKLNGLSVWPARRARTLRDTLSGRVRSTSPARSASGGIPSATRARASSTRRNGLPALTSWQARANSGATSREKTLRRIVERGVLAECLGV